MPDHGAGFYGQRQCLAADSQGDRTGSQSWRRHSAVAHGGRASRQVSRVLHWQRALARCPDAAIGGSSQESRRDDQDRAGAHGTGRIANAAARRKKTGEPRIRTAGRFPEPADVREKAPAPRPTGAHNHGHGLRGPFRPSCWLRCLLVCISLRTRPRQLRLHSARLRCKVFLALPSQSVLAGQRRRLLLGPPRTMRPRCEIR